MDAGKKALNRIGVEVGKKQVIWGRYPLIVAGFVLHPTYRIDRKPPDKMLPSGSDIAIISLKSRLVFSSNIQTICLPSPRVLDKHVVVQTGGWGNTYAVGEDLKQHSCMTNELGKAIFENCRHHDHTPCAQSKENKTTHPHYDSRCKNWWRFGKFILNERIPKTQHLGRETIMKFYTPEGNKVSCYG